MGRLNQHAIDNIDIEFHPSEFTFEFNSESIPCPNTTLIKPIDDNEREHLLELFHSGHDDNILDVDRLQMLNF